MAVGFQMSHFTISGKDPKILKRALRSCGQAIRPAFWTEQWGEGCAPVTCHTPLPLWPWSLVSGHGTMEPGKKKVRNSEMRQK